MNLTILFQRSVCMFGSHPALALGTQKSITYTQLNNRILSLAHWMRTTLNLREGDRVTIAMKNCPEYIEATLAIWHAGLCPVPVNHKLHFNEINYIIENSNSKACISEGETYAKLQTKNQTPHIKTIDVKSREWQHTPSKLALSDIAGIHKKCSDLAWLFYTSGTTGRPKGAMLSHANLIAMALNFHADVLEINDTDALIHAAPMSHGSGLYSIPYWMHGGLQVIPPSGEFNEFELFQLIDFHKNSSLFAPPTIINRMVKHANIDRQSKKTHAYKNLKCIVSGGAPFYTEEIKSAVHCFGPRIAHIYGQGESPMTITALKSKQIFDAVKNNDNNTLSSVGFPQTSVKIEIKDEGNNNLGVNGVGEVTISSPTVMMGYWNDPEATNSAIKNNALKTGDVGLIDERGLLHLKDRSKDIIISGGSNIYPREVEEVLLQHHDVQEVSVVGLPDSEWGESVAAFIVLRDTATVSKNDLDHLCLQSIARFKRPKHYIFIQQLPKNSTGKVLKNKLRTMNFNEKTHNQQPYK